MKKRDSRKGGEGVPTDLRGKLTESQLRKSKNLAKRRRQTNFTKFKAKKGSENRQNPAKATFDTVLVGSVWVKKYTKIIIEKMKSGKS